MIYASVLLLDMPACVLRKWKWVVGSWKWAPFLRHYAHILGASIGKRTCEATPAGKNSSFIFTVGVKSVPLIILSLPMFTKPSSKNGEMGRFIFASVSSWPLLIIELMARAVPACLISR